MGVGHDAVVVVQIVVLAVVCFDAQGGHALGEGDAHVAVLRLVALGIFDKGAQLEHLLNAACIDLLHGLVERVEPVALQA